MMADLSFARDDSPSTKLRPHMHGFIAHDHNHPILTIPCFWDSSKRLRACHRERQEMAHTYVCACAYVRLHADTLCSAYLFSVEGWRSRENSARNQALQQCGVNSISHSWVDGRKDLTEPCVSLIEATNSKMSNSRTIRTTKTNLFNKVSATS